MSPVSPYHPLLADPCDIAFWLTGRAPSQQWRDTESFDKGWEMTWRIPHSPMLKSLILTMEAAMWRMVRGSQSWWSWHRLYDWGVCGGGGGEKINIYTESWYAFATIQNVHGAIYMGPLTAKGKEIWNKQENLDLFQTVSEPKAVVVILCLENQKEELVAAKKLVPWSGHLSSRQRDHWGLPGHACTHVARKTCLSHRGWVLY